MTQTLLRQNNVLPLERAFEGKRIERTIDSLVRSGNLEIVPTLPAAEELKQNLGKYLVIHYVDASGDHRVAAGKVIFNEAAGAHNYRLDFNPDLIPQSLAALRAVRPTYPSFANGKYVSFSVQRGN